MLGEVRSGCSSTDLETVDLNKENPAFDFCLVWKGSGAARHKRYPALELCIPLAGSADKGLGVCVPIDGEFCP